MLLRRFAIASTLLFTTSALAQPDWKPSPAADLLEVALQTAALEVERVGERPTIDSRELFLLTAAMYDAWAPFDERALPAYGAVSRQKLRTDEHKRRAMLSAVGVMLYELYPAQKKAIDFAMKLRRYVPKPLDGSPEAIGALAAKQVLEARRRDGANQLGDEAGGTGEPFGDYTYYRPQNDPNRGFLTPHWYRVVPFALSSPSQFRPPPPPKELKEEVDEVIRYNATLSAEQKSLVDVLRHPHWLRFAQAVSRRDQHTLDADVKLFFAVAAACFDAVIATWEAKRFYDSATPSTLVRTLYKGKKVRGPAGEIPAEQWASPATPFPGYVSSHSAMAAAGARALELFTDSDVYDAEQTLTRFDGRGESSTLRLPTFSKTAELAGISRIMNGTQLQSDNVEGLKLGRKVADVAWVRAAALFSGKATR